MSTDTVLERIAFRAERVAAQQDEYTPECTVHGIYFGEGDPDAGGQHWNFTRDLVDDDGVCTVKEIQEVTIFGGIVAFVLRRGSIDCEFGEEASRSTGTKRLSITFDVDDPAWTAMVEQARFVFRGEPYFALDA